MIQILIRQWSNKLPVWKQDYKDYKDSGKTRPLCIFHPQETTYKRNFDENTSI